MKRIRPLCLLASLLLAALLAAAGFLAYSLLSIPSLYLYGTLAAALLLWLLCTILLYRKQLFLRLLGWILSLSLIITSAVAAGGLAAVYSLEKTASADVLEVQESMDCYVLRTSTYTAPEDLKDKTIGYIGSLETGMNRDMLEYLKLSVSGLKSRGYENLESLYQALQADRIQAVMLSQSICAQAQAVDTYASLPDVLVSIASLEKTSPEENTLANPQSASAPFAILVHGMESDAVSANGAGLFDLVIACSPKNHQALMVWLPAQTWFSKEQAPLSSISWQGMDASAAAISRLLDIPLDYYLQINMAPLADLSLQTGGIQVNNPQAFVSDGQPFPAGSLDLSGSRLLDYTRGISQSAAEFSTASLVLPAMAKKLADPALLLKAPVLYSALKNALQTSIPPAQLKAWSILLFEDFEVYTMSITGQPEMCMDAPLGVNVPALKRNDEKTAQIVQAVQQIMADETLQPQSAEK